MDFCGLCSELDLTPPKMSLSCAFSKMPDVSLGVMNGYSPLRGLKAMLCWGEGTEDLADGCFCSQFMDT